MTTAVILSESLKHLYQGEPWLDVTFMEHLQEVDAAQASKRVGQSHNIWELVNHIIFWNQNVVRKLLGENPEQDGDLPDFYLPENHGENNWQATLQRLEHSMEQTIDAIRNFPEERLYTPVQDTQHNAYYYIQGVIEHAAYHLGQIVLLRKHVAH
ncbi:DinB family protein [Chitinophaga lutea]